MGRKKAAKRGSGRGRRRAPSEYKAQALAGRAPRGREWDPGRPEAQAPALPEVNEPRPYTTRYPIPEEEFRAVKEGAPKAKLPKSTAERARDSRQKKDELSARAI